MEHIKKLRENQWLTGALLVLSALGIGLLSLCFAVTANRGAMLRCYLQRPLLLTLNLLPPVLLALFLWFLLGRAAAAYGVTAVIVFGLTLANWYKLQFRNDPLMFGDLFLAKEAGNMLGRYSLFVTKSLVAAFLILLLGGVFLFFFARGRFPKGKLRWLRFVLAGAVLLICLPVSRLYASNEIYNHKTENFDLINRWGATQLYTSKGFVYPFLHSVTSAFDAAPDGYKKAEAEKLLSAYTDEDIPQGKKVDVQAVMLEAFNDFSKYGQIPFTKDVYEEFHKLEAESVSGDLVTSIFAGGTVSTERSFVTGLNHLGSFRSQSNSYAWYLKGQGYETTGSHPCYQWFYNRQNINPNLGMSPYYFLEDHYGALAGGYIAMDKVFFPELNRLYDSYKAEHDAPYFSFSVTYQGHGPYSAEENTWGETFIEPGAYSTETEMILNNYFGSVQSTAREVSSFVDHYRELSDPVVIVIFGDHNPWLGDDNSVYRELGIDLDNSQKQGFLNYYSTRYLIWANDAAKKALGNEFTGEGPTISPNFLMTEVFSQCGWKGDAYLQYTRELMEEVPVVTTAGASITADGSFIRSPEGALKEKLDEYVRLEYYRRHNFQYQELAE